MAQLAIKGHATRGKEVIEILEMIGGKNVTNYDGSNTKSFYFLNNIIICSSYGSGKLHGIDCYTLEEFLEKFPYKVGDKVQSKGATSCGTVYVIEHMKWANNHIEYKIRPLYDYYHTGLGTLCVEDLQPYKEETMKDYLVTEEDYGKILEVEQEYIDAAERLIDQLAESTHWKCKDFDSQKMIALFLKKNTSIITEKEQETMEEIIKIDIPKGYEFTGLDDDNQQVVFEKVGCKYPKTYEECCMIIGFSSNTLKWNNPFSINRDTHPYIKHLDNLIESFCKLLICRDAYWKIAGEEMGWDKPWKPDYIEGVANTYYTIYVFNNKLFRAGTSHRSVILAFPTEKIRDAFYENFKDLIMKCMKLL